MSSEFTVSPHSWLSDTNDYTDEINNVFNERWKILDNKRQVIIDRIDKWHHDSKERIKKYVDEQKALLNDHYNRLRPTFDEKHKENLETANAYHAAQQILLFNELREACRLLKFPAAMLKSVNYEIEHPEVIIVEEPLETKNLEERDTARRRRRRNKNGNKTENTDVASASLLPNSTTSNPEQTDDPQSSKIKSKRKNDQPTVNTDDSKNPAMNNDELINKCPICFMIFPSSMTRINRQQHINEHYTDD